jgi:hypothetical protein
VCEALSVILNGTEGGFITKTALGVPVSEKEPTVTAVALPNVPPPVSVLTPAADNTICPAVPLVIKEPKFIGVPVVRVRALVTVAEAVPVADAPSALTVPTVATIIRAAAIPYLNLFIIYSFLVPFNGFLTSQLYGIGGGVGAE